MKIKNVYEIYPIVTCKMILDMGFFTYRLNYGKKVLLPVYAWLIMGGEKPFLIDTGCSYNHMMEIVTQAMNQGGEEVSAIEDALQKMGISTSDIETIIVTHIHFDHFLNAKKFPKAKLIVQEEELKFARNPHPIAYGTYQPALIEGLPFETVNGDVEIMPGVEIIFTPGHSPGGQSVSVNTKAGKMVIAGYCSIDENFSKERDIVVGMHTNLLDSYNSMVKIREVGGTVIPLHSQRLLNVKSIP